MFFHQPKWKKMYSSKIGAITPRVLQDLLSSKQKHDHPFNFIINNAAVKL